MDKFLFFGSCVEHSIRERPYGELLHIRTNPPDQSLKPSVITVTVSGHWHDRWLLEDDPPAGTAIWWIEGCPSTYYFDANARTLSISMFKAIPYQLGHYSLSSWWFALFRLVSWCEMIVNGSQLQSMLVSCTLRLKACIQRKSYFLYSVTPHPSSTIQDTWNTSRVC